MALAIMIGSIVVLLALGVVGLWRGVPRGLVSLGTTLLGAALVDLWVTTWGERVQSWLRLERSQTSTWLVALVGFLAVALFVGYGSGLLLPPSVDAAMKKVRLRVLAAPLAALLGVLNGALIVGYLLRYTIELLRRSDVTETINSTLMLRMLTVWLPWFVMGVVLATGVLVLTRMIMALMRTLNKPKPVVKPATPVPAATPAPKPVPAATPATSAPVGSMAVPTASASTPTPAPVVSPTPTPAASTTQVAGAPSPGTRLDAVSTKIDQALNDKQG